LLAETRQYAAELETLRKASLNLTASLESEDVLYAILESALLLSQDALDAHIFLYDDGKLTFGEALWADGSRGKSFAEPREDGLTYKVAKFGEVISVPDMAKHPLFEDKAKGPNGWKGAIVGLPLMVRDRVVGVMNVAYRKPQEFSEETLRSLGLLADQAALAIVNVRLHDVVRQQARTDPLTGLANRRAFDERLDEEIRRSSRYEHPFSLFMMDLDDFKRINDTYGHPTGDQALRALGECFTKNVRDTDCIARYGGDEFVMILPETGKPHAERIARKLIQTVENYPFSWKSEEDALPLTLTVGIACYPSNADTAKDLMAFADQQLYKEKEGKRSN
jgi:diguanylate cyclase (GGDEF)-like protein